MDYWISWKLFPWFLLCCHIFWQFCTRIRVSGRCSSVQCVHLGQDKRSKPPLTLIISYFPFWEKHFEGLWLLTQQQSGWNSKGRNVEFLFQTNISVCLSPWSYKRHHQTSPNLRRGHSQVNVTFKYKLWLRKYSKTCHLLFSRKAF